MLTNQITNKMQINKSASILARLNPTHKLLLGLVLMNVLWGASWVPYKVILNEIPVPVFATVRLTLAVLMLAPFAWRDMRAQIQAGGLKFGWKQMPRLLLLTLVGVVLNNVFLYNGASLAPATDASLLAISETLFTALLAWLFLKEKFPLLKVLGLALGAFGVYLLVAQGLYLPNLNGHALGDLLLLAGFGFESLYTLMGTSSARRYPPLALLTATNLMGLLFWAPAAAFSMQQQHWAMPVVDWQGLASLAYLVIVCSVVGYAVWFKTLRHAEASLASVTLFVQPLSGSVVGAVLLGEILTVFNALGGGLIVVSLGLLAFGSTRRKTAANRPSILKTNTATPFSTEYVALGAGEKLSQRVDQTFEQVLGEVEADTFHAIPPSCAYCD